MSKPKTYFKVGDRVVHQGTPSGHHKGVECYVLDELHKADVLWFKGTERERCWVHSIDIKSIFDGSDRIVATPEMLRLWHPPATMGFEELVTELNKELETA